MGNIPTSGAPTMGMVLKSVAISFLCGPK